MHKFLEFSYTYYQILKFDLSKKMSANKFWLIFMNFLSKNVEILLNQDKKEYL